jgi:phage recombination protein Bet
VAACNRTGLDPFTKQIYLIDLKGKKTVIVAIDGLRLVAQRSKDYDGLEGPWFCGPDEVWKEVWTGKEKPIACKVVAYRKGSRVGFTSTRYWAETGKTSGNWATMPLHMFAKCTEASALRMAFPLETSGLYIAEEITVDAVDRPTQGERVQAIKLQDAEVVDDLPTDPEEMERLKAASDAWHREVESAIELAETAEQLTAIAKDETWKVDETIYEYKGYLRDKTTARADALGLPRKPKASDLYKKES